MTTNVTCFFLFCVCQMQDKLVRVQESHETEIEGMKKEAREYHNKAISERI